jgi:hypothetical protein
MRKKTCSLTAGLTACYTLLTAIESSQLRTRLSVKDGFLRDCSAGGCGVKWCEIWIQVHAYTSITCLSAILAITSRTYGASITYWQCLHHHARRFRNEDILRTQYIHKYGYTIKFCTVHHSRLRYEAQPDRCSALSSKDPPLMQVQSSRPQNQRLSCTT